MHALIALLLIFAQVRAYDLSTTDGNYRSTICASQKGFCSSFCGGPSNTKYNWCHTPTMQWGCTCIDLTKATNGRAADSEFPVQYYQCTGEKQDCKRMCQQKFGVETAQTISCQYQCEVDYTCGSAKGGEKVNLRAQGDGKDILQGTETSAAGTAASDAFKAGSATALAAFLITIL